MDKAWTRRLIEDIDWIGAAGISTALGILLYDLATTTSSYRRFLNIVLLVVSIVLLGVFPLHMDYQVKHQGPAISNNPQNRPLSYAHGWRNVLVSPPNLSQNTLSCPSATSKVALPPALDGWTI